MDLTLPTTSLNGTTEPIAVDVDPRGWEQDAFQNLIDRDTGGFGRVVSSEKELAGSHEIYF